MYYRCLFAIVTITAIGGLTLLGCSEGEGESEVKQAGDNQDNTAKVQEGLAELVVDKDAPLLLDEPAETKEANSLPTKQVADNSQCFVCHANYKGEKLSSWHAEANVGCADCHGKSSGHSNDEFHEIAPDIIYGKEQIDGLCQKCHEAHIESEELVKLWQKYNPDKAVPKIIACTDCHGEHRLKSRSVRWDKKTRELLPDK